MSPSGLGSGSRQGASCVEPERAVCRGLSFDVRAAWLSFPCVFRMVTVGLPLGAGLARPHLRAAGTWARDGLSSERAEGSWEGR